MTYVKNSKINLLILLLVFCLAQISSQKVFSKDNFKVEGNVIAYSFTPSEWQTSALGFTNILVVKVIKVIEGKGKEKSKFILVHFRGDKKEFALSELKEDKVFNFNLTKHKSCDATINDIKFIKDIDDKGNLILLRSDLKFISEKAEESIPEKETMPCYYLK